MVAPLIMMGLSAAADIIGGIGNAISNATAPKPANDAQLHKTADDFEKMFLEQSVDRLTQGGGEEGPLGENGTGGGIYRSMLAKQYAGEIEKSGGVGISAQIYHQMLQMQEGAGNAGGG